MLFSVREGEGQAVVLVGLPELVVGGLPEEAAGELLATSSGVRVEAQVSREVVAGVAGNPLALVELAGELTAAKLSGACWAGRWRFGGALAAAEGGQAIRVAQPRPGPRDLPDHDGARAEPYRSWSWRSLGLYPIVVGSLRRAKTRVRIRSTLTVSK